MNILIFGDQSTPSSAVLGEPCQTLDNKIIQDFVARTDIALRQQIGYLSRLQRDLLGDVPLHHHHQHDGSSLLQGWATQGATHPVLRPVLTAAGQCVDLLRYLQSNRDNTAHSSHRIVLGSCTGLLTASAATALGSLSCPSDWVPLAVETVCIAFRVGIYTASTSERLTGQQRQPGSGSSLDSSWSSVVQGGRISQLEPVLAEFHHDRNIPTALQAYISASTPGSVTVSGPQQTLRKFFDSTEFRAVNGCSTPVSIPIFSPYHAAHLYSSDSNSTGLRQDVDWIFRGAGASFWDDVGKKYRQVSTLLSTKDGKPFVAGDLPSLFRQVIQQILVDVLRWDTVVDEVAAQIPNDCPSVQVTVMGSSNLGKSVVNALNKMATLTSDGKKRNWQHHISLTSTTDIAAQNPTMNPSNQQQQETGQTKIAIIGMSGRFPGGAKTPSDLWNILSQGLDLHSSIPPDRFPVETHVDPTGKRKNTSQTPYGCFLDSPGSFDPSFFHLSPREAQTTDPMQRLALVCAYEALEMAGYVPNRTPSSSLDRAATFLGQTLDDYREFNSSQNIDPFYVTGGLRPFGPGRVSYFYKFTGPSYVVDTACSSSLAAIHLACASLRGGECDMAVAGGTNIITGSDMYAGLSRGQFLSRTGNCKTLDSTADGYCRADGVGTLVLKRLDDALSDNDPVLGLILASATNHSSMAASITQPHGATQEKLFRTVLGQAGVRPEEVDYIEMHGTGTQIGDLTEMTSIVNVFSQQNSGKKKKETPIHVGSLKANLGHSEAAAGVAAVMKGLLMFERSVIPPHVGIKSGEVNHKFPPDLEARHGIRIPREAAPFGGQKGMGRGRIMLVNNFGAAGGNTSLLLEEPPQNMKGADGDDDNGNGAEESEELAVHHHDHHHIMPISAKTASSLRANIQRMASFLQQHPNVSLADLSYTLTSRRQHYRHRFVTVSSTLDELEQALLAYTTSTTTTSSSSAKEKTPLVFTFTGQGSIYTGVAQSLFVSSRQFHTDLLAFDSLAVSYNFPSVLPLLDPKVDLTSLSTVQAQLGQVIIQMALYRLFVSRGVVSSDSGVRVVGHSLGEYAALFAASILSAADTIFAAGKRAELIERFCVPGTHAMLAVRSSCSTVEALLGEVEDEQVEIACINGPNDVVLGGAVGGLQEVQKRLTSKGIRSTMLPVPFACHSAQFDPVLDPFQHELEQTVTFHPPQVPLLSPLLGRAIHAGEKGVVDARYLARHLRERVDFLGALGSISAPGENDTDQVQFVEIGPHPICSGMVVSILGGDVRTIPSLKRGVDADRCFAESLAALYLARYDIDWEEHVRDSAGAADKAKCLPNLPAYAFDDKNYWIEYKGDWALSKGDLAAAANGQTRSGREVDLVSRGPATASVQRLLEESFDEKDLGTAKADFESDLMLPELYDAIAGHVINGVGLCPSGVFADMAFTVGRYMFQHTLSGFNDMDMEIVNMDIISPLVLEVGSSSNSRKPLEGRIIRISATIDTSNGVKACLVEFSDGKSSESSAATLYAKCTILLRDTTTVITQWRRSFKHLVTSRISHLQTSKQANRLHRRMVYKLFGAVVDYSDRFQGMDEVLMDRGQSHEAVAQIAFKTSGGGGGGGGGNFFRSPYWIDNLTQLSGFVLNGHESVDTTKTVYISNGWESMQVVAGLSDRNAYTAYVRMEPLAEGAVAGDMYVLDEQLDELVCVVKGIRFQGVPRPLLRVLLAPPSSQGRTSSSPSPAKQVVPGGHLPPSSSTSSTSLSSLATSNPRKTVSGTSSPATSVSSSGQVHHTTSPSGGKLPLTQLVLSALCEELGITADELDDDKSFAEMGVDSLMSLTVVGRLREQYELDFPLTLFQHPTDTVRKLVSSLDAQGEQGQQTIPSSVIPQPQVPEPVHRATSVLLQGNPRTAGPTNNLFLFPGGFGTSSSFAPLPQLFPSSGPGNRKGAAIFGLNSAFVNCPEQFTDVSIPQMASLYLQEIRRRQPDGPYSLLGYSVGGIIAYEACRQLVLEGQKVEQLYLVDAPCPLVIPPMPPALIQFLDSIDRFTGKPKSVSEQETGGGGEVKAMGSLHVTQTLIALESYMPSALPADKVELWPQTTYYVAKQGVVHKDYQKTLGRPEDASEQERKVMDWLLDDRAGMGGTGDGWEMLVGGAEENKLRIVPVEGNHFSIMKEPFILEWAADLSGNYWT